MKVIISGGGSGGHIFPAIAIANAIRARHADADILFVGAEGKMEMEKVPAAGYPIEGLPIAGLQRKLTPANLWKNLQLPLKMIRSRAKVKRILADFRPDVVVGVGGFASEPTLKAAASLGYPTLLQEQNSYAGLTNKLLSRSARTICVAYDGMQRFFPADKIVFTGNPVRADIEHMACSREEGLAHFALSPSMPTVLVVGGSLGARSINQMMLAALPSLASAQVQYIWQTGRWGFDEAQAAIQRMPDTCPVKVHQFIQRMDLAYAAADLVVSRAGAIAISELCLVGKPVILIPSPNVAEDHQTKNALALVDKGAALMVPDAECATKALPLVDQLLKDQPRMQAMRQAIQALAVRGAADKIVDQIEKIAK